jgi:hypothetical protein
VHIDMYSTFSRQNPGNLSVYMLRPYSFSWRNCVLKKFQHYEQKTSKQFSVTNPFLEKGLEFGATVLADHREISQNPT